MAVIKSGASSSNLTVDAGSLAARASLYDTAGNPIAIETGWSGNKYLGVCMNQDVEISILNSNLTYSQGAGTTWSGSSEASTGVAGIQINTFITQKHTVTVYQSMDGTNWDISDSWTDPANYGSARTIQATASYYYVTVKNEGSSSATGRVQTALCPVVEALPRALTSGGNLRVSVQADWQSSRKTTGLYMVNTYRTIGSAASPQNIFVLQNPALSTVNVAVRGLNVTSDSTAVLTSVTPMVRISRGTTISGGTSLTANIGKYQTQYPSPQATALGATTTDDAALTTINATAGATLWTQNLDRLHTAVGWVTHPVYNLLPDVGSDLRQIILVPGENLLVQVVGTAAATTTMNINCSWLEYTA